MFLAHGHFDHISAADEIRSFYGVKIYALDKERETLADPRLNGDAGFLKQNVRVVPDVFWHDGEEFQCLGETWKVIWTPGHTPGGMSYYIPAAKAVFSGDTLFLESVGRTDFPGGSMSAIVHSIRDVLMTLPDDTEVYPGHGALTTIGHERENNPYL